MAVRMIRTRPGQDTQMSLKLKQTQAQLDIEEAKKLKYITKSIENSGTKEEFMKNAAVYVVFQLYKLKS